VKIVDDRNSGVKRVDGEKRVVVKIAEERDGETIERARPAREGKIFVDDTREVGLDHGGIARESELQRQRPSRGIHAWLWEGTANRFSCGGWRLSPTYSE
jgi:hypothetical protein